MFPSKSKIYIFVTIRRVRKVSYLIPHSQQPVKSQRHRVIRPEAAGLGWGRVTGPTPDTGVLHDLASASSGMPFARQMATLTHHLFCSKSTLVISVLRHLLN